MNCLLALSQVPIKSRMKRQRESFEDVGWATREGFEDLDVDLVCTFT
jgi:hypothetical protein